MTFDPKAEARKALAAHDGWAADDWLIDSIAIALRRAHNAGVEASVIYLNSVRDEDDELLTELQGTFCVNIRALKLKEPK